MINLAIGLVQSFSMIERIFSGLIQYIFSAIWYIVFCSLCMAFFSFLKEYKKNDFHWNEISGYIFTFEMLSICSPFIIVVIHLLFGIIGFFDVLTVRARKFGWDSEYVRNTSYDEISKHIFGVNYNDFCLYRPYLLSFIVILFIFSSNLIKAGFDFGDEISEWKSSEQGSTALVIAYKFIAYFVAYLFLFVIIFVTIKSFDVQYMVEIMKQV